MHAAACNAPKASHATLCRITPPLDETAPTVLQRVMPPLDAYVCVSKGISAARDCGEMGSTQVARYAALACAAAGMMLGAALVFLAWKHASQAQATTAVALLLGCPALALFAVLGAPPAPLPLQRQRRAERVLTLIRIVRAHVCMAASYLVVLWFCQLGGVMALRQFLVYYSVATSASLAS